MMMMMMIRTTVNERVFLRADYISVCVCVAELFICRYIKPPGRNDDDDEEILSFFIIFLLSALVAVCLDTRS